MDEVCIPEGLPCTPRSCEPAIDCRFRSEPSVAACAINLTISGRTCTTAAGVGASNGAADTALAVDVELSNGSVNALNLPNTWISPSAGVEGRIVGTDLGRTSAGVYKSEILTEGPRGGPYGEVAPSLNHTWTEIGVFVRHDSTAGREGVLVAVWFLDMMPDGCFVRTQSGIQDTPCPSIAQTWNLIPALP